ncbi:MAG: hypothetical protein K2N81_06080, partial [Acetatifactor sp.]|nr:hypothetical protein [Acetatifactor sp.]
YNISANTVNVYQQESGRDSVDALYETGIKALNAGNIQLAEKCFDDIKKYYPSDYRGPWGKMKCYSKGNIFLNIKGFEQEYANACILANAEQLNVITNEYNDVIQKYKQKSREEERRKQAAEAARQSEEIRKQTLYAERKLKSAKRDLYFAIIFCAVCCAPFLCSLIFNFDTLVQILLVLPFVVGIGGIILGLGGEITNVKEAKKHYQAWKSGQYHEKNWD